MEKMKRIAGPILLALILTIVFSVPVFGAQTPSVGASGAAVIDFETGEFYYEKNGDTARPIASMTKVMSIYLVFEAIERGDLSLDSMVTASSYAAKVSANKNYSGHEGLVAGKQYKVDDLLKVILTASANGSVIVLAEAVSGSESAFVAKMNAKAQEMGITAHFADCCGLVSNGNAVTPKAMAQLAVNLIRDYPDVLKYTSLKSTSFNGKTFNSTNSLLKNNSVAGIDGLKTGTTSAAGYCYTATANQNDRRIIAVVMKATSSAARFTDAKAMLEYGFATRSEREVQWAQAEKMEWDITYSPARVLPLQSVTLTASVSNIDADVSIPCSEKWLVNGSPVASTEKDMTLTADTTSSFTYTPSMTEKEVRVTYQLRFPGGDLYTAEEIVPVADPPSETYTVVWMDEDETVLEIDRKLAYGTMPSYNGPQPAKEETEQALYTFAGWDKALSPVIGHMTYKATYQEHKKGTAVVTFKVANGTWSDGTAADRSVTLNTLDGAGTLTSAQVPSGMKAGEGYQGGSWNVQPNTSEKGITGNVTYTYSFQAVPHSEICPSRGFRDISQNGWYHEAVDYALASGVMQGTSATTFEPNTKLTRGTLVTILYRLAGSPFLGSDEQGSSDFYDVGDGLWYTDPISWAASYGVVSGYGDGRFGPNDPITREQFAIILYRYASIVDQKPVDPGSGGNLSMFIDANRISDWARAGLQWANNTGLITGKTANTIAPAETATRAEAATILMRYMK